MTANRGLIGAAGEYALASELSRRGWLATVTLKNSPDIDVLARHVESRHLVAIQVKTVSPGRKAFQLKTSQEVVEREPNEPDEWMAFVRFKEENERASFHLVPTKMVAAVLYAVRRDAEERGKKVGPWRNFLTDWVDDFAEAWEALNRPALEVGIQPRKDVLEMIARFGRPEDQALFGARVLP